MPTSKLKMLCRAMCLALAVSLGASGQPFCPPSATNCVSVTEHVPPSALSGGDLLPNGSGEDGPAAGGSGVAQHEGKVLGLLMMPSSPHFAPNGRLLDDMPAIVSAISTACDLDVQRELHSLVADQGLNVSEASPAPSPCSSLLCRTTRRPAGAACCTRSLHLAIEVVSRTLKACLFCQKILHSSPLFSLSLRSP